LLELDVDVEHDVVTALRLDRRYDPDRVAEGVHLDDLRAGMAP
jgi:hypothetical protein